MAIEQFANTAQTTLNGTITSSATTLVATSASAFPTLGNFRIVVDAEIMLVTAVNGANFTITRGIENTTATSHTSGVMITQVLTVGSLQCFARLDTGTALAAAAPLISLNMQGPQGLNTTSSLFVNRITGLKPNAVLLGSSSNRIAYAVTGIAGQLLLDQGSGNAPSFNPMSGDGTITNAGVITISSISGIKSKYLAAIATMGAI